MWDRVLFFSFFTVWESREKPTTPNSNLIHRVSLRFRELGWAWYSWSRTMMNVLSEAIFPPFSWLNPIVFFIYFRLRLWENGLFVCNIFWKWSSAFVMSFEAFLVVHAEIFSFPSSSRFRRDTEVLTCVSEVNFPRCCSPLPPPPYNNWAHAMKSWIGFLLRVCNPPGPPTHQAPEKKEKYSSGEFLPIRNLCLVLPWRNFCRLTSLRKETFSLVPKMHWFQTGATETMSLSRTGENVKKI